MKAPIARRPPDMEFLGLPMHRVGVDQVHQFIADVIEAQGKAIALNLNVFCVNLAMKNPWLHEFIRGSHLVFCDGDGVRMGLKLLGYQPPPKITYREWFWQLSGFCAERGYSLFLVGSAPGVAHEAAARLTARFPRLKIAGTHHGFFQKHGTETDELVRRINAAAPDVLLICLGMPTQERWIMEHWERIDAHVFLKGGAALEYATGRLANGPAWMIRWHMEWLFRLLQDPVRLSSRYVIGNPYFLYRILCEKARRTLASQRT